MLSYNLKRLKRPIVLLITFFFPVIFLNINAQCTITGTSVNSGSLVCNSFSSCSIIYVGDGISTTNVTINNKDLDLRCLNPIQFVVRNNATLLFNSSGRLYLPIGSNIVIESGGNLVDSQSCNASQRIYIGNTLISSCNGEGGALESFPEIVTNGGYNSINASAIPSSFCGSGSSLITVSANPANGAIFEWYDAPSGGNLLQSGSSNVFNTGIITVSKTYYVLAYYSSGSYSTVRKAVTVTVNPIPSKPAIGTITQPTCQLSTGSVVLNGLPSGNWLINPGAINGTGSSATISGLTLGTYNYTVTNSAGCTSLISNNVVINFQPSNNIWIGSKDANWNEPLNWCNGVPSISNNLDVIIPSALSTPNSPKLSSGDFGYVENIFLESGSILTIENNYLYIKNNLKLNGKIDLNDESQLVQDTGSTFDSASIGSIEIDQQGTSDNFKYNYWGSPVNSAGTNYTIAGVLRDGTISTVINENKHINFGTHYTYADGAVTSPIKLSSYWMYKFDNKTSSDYNAWSRIAKDGVLKQGEGFTMKGSNSILSEQNYTFVGKPNNGDIYLPISAGKQYLIGNPYPSAIDAKEFIRNNISSENGGYNSIDVIDGTLYFWDHFGGGTHLLKSYEGGYSVLTLIGSEEASAIDPLINNTKEHSIKNAQRFIPIAQGFFVTGATSLTKTEYIQFNNNLRTFKKENASVSVFLKGSSKNNVKKEGSKDNIPRIRLQFNSPRGYQRELLVGVDEHASNKYDLGYDAPLQNIASEDMFWVFDERKFIIQGVNNFNEDQELPLGIIIKQDGLIKIQISDLENVETSTEISIKDNITGLIYKINNTPFEIEMVAGEYKDRFSVVFKPSVTLGIEEEVLEDGVKVYINNKTSELQIINNKDLELLSVCVFNYLGQKINSWSSKQLANDRVSLPIRSSAGVYLVKIKSTKGDFVKKIILD